MPVSPNFDIKRWAYQGADESEIDGHGAMPTRPHRCYSRM
jgi:hypothetical protein